MKVERVALIHDNRPRPETTGTYCLRALQGLVQVQHVLPDQLDQISRADFDLFLNIDDGLRDRLPAHLHPCAWWVIDTHMDAAWAEEKGRDFDWLFAAQRDGAERLCRAGLPANWLPLAHDPGIHRPHGGAKRWEVSFVGMPTPGPRSELLQFVQRHFPNGFMGQAYFDEYAQVLSQSRIGFNRSVKNDVNMRVFETLGCGTLLATNDLRENGQEELLVSDKHCLTYQSAEELLDKLRFYLTHDDIRERIAQAGHAEARARHTYRHRMQSLLDVVNTHRSPATSTLGGTHTSGGPAACEAPAGSRSDKRRHHTGPNVSDILTREPLCDSPSAGVGIFGSAVSPLTVQPRRPAHNCCDVIDFIIKTFLRPQALLRLLRSIMEFYPDSQVTIADDGNLRESADADSRACCQLIDGTDNFILHCMPFAAGVTPGRNLLVDETSRRFLLLLDDDFCFTAETRIERLLERLQTDPELGVVAGACIDVVGIERRLRNSGGTLRIDGDTLHVNSQEWTDRQNCLRDYIPQFALFRREVFADVRWEGGIGAEHYDLCLQLQKSGWKVAHDLTVTIDHYHFSKALAGYDERRFDFAEAQQWLLRKWNLRRIVQDGQLVVELAGNEATTKAEQGSAHPGTDVPGSRTLWHHRPH